MKQNWIKNSSVTHLKKKKKKEEEEEEKLTSVKPKSPRHCPGIPYAVGWALKTIYLDT